MMKRSKLMLPRVYLDKTKQLKLSDCPSTVSTTASTSWRDTMLDHDDEVLSLLADDDIPSAQPHPDDTFGMEESPEHAMLREVLLHGRCEAASMGAAPEPPPCDAQSALQDQLQNAVDAGMFSTHSALGKRFAREVAENKEFANKYSDERSHKAKAAFRQRWAIMKLAEVKEQGKVRSQEYTTIDREKGSYESLARIVELQGFRADPKGAMRRGANYAKRCLAMKGQWLWVNPMTEELEFFYVRKEHITSFCDSWTMYEKSTPVHAEHTDKQEEGDEQKAKPKMKAATRDGKTPKDRSEGDAGSEQTGQRNRGDQDGNKSKKPKTAAGNLIKEANSLKVAYHKSMGQVTSMVRNIKNDNVGWAWANNSQNLGVLQQKNQDVEDFLHSDDHEVLAQDLAAMKTSMGPDTFASKLQHFMLLKPLLKEMESFQKKNC